MPYHVTEVFTPTTVAKVTFVEREKINTRLVNALRTPGTQVVVYGRSGCGKSTLLTNKLAQIYEREVVSQCTLDTTLEHLLLDAFDRLGPFMDTERIRSRSNSRSAGLNVTFASVRASLSRNEEQTDEVTSTRALPPQLTPSLLARLLGEVDACWVLEDFHKVKESEKQRLSQIMKLFMDLAAEYPRVKIIAIGAVVSARQIVQYDREMWNRVAEIEVPLMTPEELDEIMEVGSGVLDISFADTVKVEIQRLSNGLPAVCHQLCLNLCFNAGLEIGPASGLVFDDEHLIEAVEQWIENSADSLREEYDRATRAKRIRKFDNCRLIIQALAPFGPDGATHPELLCALRRVHLEYPAGNLTLYLTQLSSQERGFVLAKDIASGRFRFASPMMHAYARAVDDGPRPATPLASRTVSRVDFAYTRYLPTPCLRPNALRSSVMVLARVKPFLW